MHPIKKSAPFEPSASLTFFVDPLDGELVLLREATRVLDLAHQHVKLHVRADVGDVKLAVGGRAGSRRSGVSGFRGTQVTEAQCDRVV